jgi:hypothetical protein
VRWPRSKKDRCRERLHCTHEVLHQQRISTRNLKPRRDEPQLEFCPAFRCPGVASRAEELKNCFRKHTRKIVLDNSKRRDQAISISGKPFAITKARHTKAAGWQIALWLERVGMSVLCYVQPPPSCPVDVRSRPHHVPSPQPRRRATTRRIHCRGAQTFLWSGAQSR